MTLWCFDFQQVNAGWERGKNETLYIYLNKKKNEILKIRIT